MNEWAMSLDREKRELLNTSRRAGEKFFLTDATFGAVAQLVECRVRNAEVRGSTPLGSTIFPHKPLCFLFSFCYRIFLVLSCLCLRPLNHTSLETEAVS